MDNNNLMNIAKEMKKRAYAPYSNFRVGAALLTKSGKVYRGANIENASYGATICAERVALFNAVSDGEKDFIKIAIDGDDDNYTFPCGICRQVFSEFSNNLEIILSNKDGDIKSFKSLDLLPHSFGLEK